MSTQKLGEFLQEVSDWSWEDFVKAEKDLTYSSNQGIIFALVRACAMEKLPAIKIALNRLDGKLKTPIKIEYPKFYYIYPNAKLSEHKSSPIVKDDPILIEQADAVVSLETVDTPYIASDTEILDAMPLHEDLPSMGLRDTLTALGKESRQLPQEIIRLADETHQWVERRGPEPSEIPRVKSVVAAHLLQMAQNRNIDALGEVLDQIDGKLVETLQVLGDDVYITSYSVEAPPGALPNAEGILQIEATNSQNTWAEKLGRETII